MSSFLVSIDDTLLEIFQQWNATTVILVILILGIIIYSLSTYEDPDIHPLFLQRQGNVALVRNEGESATYRSSETPEDYPLRSGLAAKLPTDLPYSSAHDGDLRYIWKAVTGEWPSVVRTEKGTKKETDQIFQTVYGKKEIETHSIQSLNKEIMIIGDHLDRHSSKKLAIYLPNSVEFLSSVFAASFYGLNLVLIPFNLPHVTILNILQDTKADALVAGAGSLPLHSLSQGLSSLKQVIWVVEKTSRHMDWTDVPEGLGGRIDVSVWHEVIGEFSGDSIPSPPQLESEQMGKIVTLWDTDALQSVTKSLMDVDKHEFSHGNFVASIASLISVLPKKQRLNSSDTFLCADLFTNTFCLSHTMAALYSGSSIVFTSVAGPQVDLSFASKQISPTVVVASAWSAAELHSVNTPLVQGGLRKFSHSLQLRSLATGMFPKSKRFTGQATNPLIGSTAGTLRLLIISEKSKTANPPLSSSDLNDLRLFTGARIIYALTAAEVAGAVSQTNIYDYRIFNSHKYSHFGSPLSCLEIKLVDTAEHKTTDEISIGSVTVSGNSVVDGKAELEILGKFNDDLTLSYA